MCFRVRRRGGAARLELEVRQQVVGEHHELLPRTVGGVGLGRDAVEGQPGLELRDGLLVVAPPTGEVPHVADRQREVTRDRRVFVVPIVRIKQVELIVLGGPVVDLLPIDGHGHGDVPGRLHARHGEAGHAGRHRHPGGTVPDVALQIQPAIERDFDGIAHAAARQPRRHDDAGHIDRPCAQPQRGQQLAPDGRGEGLEAGDRPHIVKCRSHRLNVRVVGTTRTVPNRWKIGSAAT